MSSDGKVYLFKCVCAYNPSDYEGHEEISCIPIDVGDELEVDAASMVEQEIERVRQLL